MVLILDIEKAYDRVDWAFLHATLSKLGFDDKWINGVSALYLNAHSKVLVAGGIGERIQLSRLVCQG